MHLKGHESQIGRVRTPIAKLAGAPASAMAGIDCRLRIGDSIRTGDPLFHVHAQTSGELDYAMEYAAAHPDIFLIEGVG